MARRIQLTKSETGTVVFPNYGAYRLRVDVTDFEGNDIDGNVFIYRRNPPSPHTDLSTDIFEAVAGPPQLADIPAGAPDPDQSWPYYRLSYVELDVASTAQATAIWDEIQHEVGVLVAAMNLLDTLQPTQVVWIPDAPETSTSSSI